MESQCCVLGCTDSKDEKIKLHRFPFGDHLLLPIWIMATNRTNWMPNANSRMCDKHFTIDDYVSGNRNNRLKPNACPIITPSTSTVYSNTLHVDDSASDNHFSDGKSYDSSDCDSPNTSDLIISDDSSLFSDSSMDVCSVLGDSNDVEHSDDEKKNTIKPEQEEDAISISSYITNYDDTDRIPVQKCAVTLCNQKARNQFDKLFYINFPVENETLSDSWWTLCGQQTDFDRTAKICSIHFDAADFVNKTIQKDGQIYRQTSLKNDSVVPSLYLSAEDYYRFSKKRKRKADKIDESNVKKMSIENYKCPVTNCTKTSLDENINFFTFPTGDQLKLKFWLKSLKMPGWKPLDTDRICSDHFESDQIIKTHNVYQLTSNAKPVFKPKKPFVMPTIKNNNTTNKKKSDKRVIKQPGIKVSYQRISPDCIVVNEVDLTQDGCEVNSNKCTTSSAHADKLEKNETLITNDNAEENVIDLLEDSVGEGEGDPKKSYVNDTVQSFLDSFAKSILPSDFKNSPFECKEKTLENVDVDSFENHKDNLDAVVEILIKAAKESESNITQEVSENEDLSSNNVIGLEHLLSSTQNDNNSIELLANLSMTSIENQLLETDYFQEEDKDQTGSENKTSILLEIIRDLAPEKYTKEDTCVNDETQELVPEISVTEDKEELSSRNINYLEYIYTDTPLVLIQECVVDDTVDNETQELVLEKCTEETTVNCKSQELASDKYVEDITGNDETQVLMLEKGALEDTEKTEYSKSNNQFEYIHTDTPLEFIQECVVETSIDDETEVFVAGKCIIQDKEENELVNNESHLGYVHTNTPLKFVQECEVETAVNKKTPLLLPEKHTDKTTTENTEKEAKVSENCTTDTLINAETQEVVLENSNIQGNKGIIIKEMSNYNFKNTVTDNKNNQDNVNLCASNDKNTEKMTITHSKKKLRNTKSRLQGKKGKNDKEENELVNNKSHLEYVHTNTPLKFIQECEVETIVNKKTPLLLPEKHTDETTTENTESQVIVSEKCTIDTSNNSEIQDVVLENSIIQENTVKDNKINQDNVNLPVSNDKNTEQSPVTHNKKRLRSTKSRLPENHTDETTTTENTENQEIVHENSLTQENKCTVEVDKNNRDNVNLYSPNDKNNELLPITRSKKRLRNTKSRLQGKKGKNDKEENELVNNKSHLEYVHTDTPLKFIQQCEVETIVNKKTPLLLPEKHTDETTTENTESQVKVSEKCTTETSLNAETQEVVLENSFIQENTVKDNKNNQDNVNLCTSNDKNTEQLPITRNKKSLRNTKSKSLGKRVKSGIPECTHLVHDQELPDFMKESLLLLDKDYDLYVSDSEPCASIDGVPEDEYANAITYIKTIPRVLSSYDVPNKSRKQFFVTTISVDYIYKGYSEEYSKNGKSPPYTKQQFVQIYNQYTKSFVHNV